MDNEGARKWCEKNYDSDPDYCDALGFGKKGMKSGGKVKKSGGKVRGAGIAKQGVRKCKMR